MSDRSSEQYLLAVAFPAGGHVIPLANLLKQLHDHDEFLQVVFVVSECCVKHLLTTIVLPEKYTERIQVISLTDELSENDIQTDVTGETLIKVKNAMDPALDDILPGLLLRAAGLVWDYYVPRAGEIAERYLHPTRSYCVVACLGSTPHVTDIFQNFVEVIKTEFGRTEKYWYNYSIRDRNSSEAFPVSGSHAEIIYECARPSNQCSVILNWHQELAAHLADFTWTTGRSFDDPTLFIGPLPNTRIEPENKEHWTRIEKWLDAQPDSSVVYCVFGNNADFDQERLENCVIGLLHCKRPFALDLDKHHYEALRRHKSKKLLDQVETQFSSSAVAKFLILPGTPRKEMLSHSAAGVFVSRCDWSSVLEAILNGKPIVGWPMSPSQFANACLLEGRGMGVRVGKVRASGEYVVTNRELTDAIEKVGGVWAKEKCTKGSYHEKASAMQLEVMAATEENGSSTRNFRELSRRVRFDDDV